MSFSGREELRVTKDDMCWVDHLIKAEQAACRQGAIPERSPAAKQWCNLHSKYHFRPVLLGKLSQKLTPNKSNQVHITVLSGKL